MAKHNKIGEIGESVVCKFFKKKGFKIIERNYWKPWGEIDIIAKKGGTVHFIEVKTSSCTIQNNKITGSTGYLPEEKVDNKKMRKLNRVIMSFIKERNLRDKYQTDIAVVYLDLRDKKAKINVLYNFVP